RLRYQEHMPYAKVGSAIGVSSERARQITAKALRKLRHPTRTGILTIGLYEHITRIKETRFEISKCDVCPLKNNVELTDDRLKLSIEQMDFSVRTYNCLKRANVNTMRDLLKRVQADDLMNVRNLGKRSYDECFEKMREFGIVCDRTEK
ncbi:MAG: hypothetical protein K2O54_06880, partial [Prevotella sp.]|nr:hypothetical protein [Prevotella sp.]